MKRIIIAASAIAMLASAGAASAQGWQGGQGGRPQGQGGQWQGQQNGQWQGGQRPQQQQQSPQQQQPRPQQQAQNGGPRGIAVGEPNGRGPDRGGWDRNDRRDGRDGRGWNDRRDDRGGWNRGGDRRHNLGAYYAPRGYAVRSWSFGQVMPSAYWGGSYVLRDYWRYDLPRPRPGTQWVRSGSDAVLVDFRGRVIDVERHLFW